MRAWTVIALLLLATASPANLWRDYPDWDHGAGEIRELYLRNLRERLLLAERPVSLEAVAPG